MSSVASIKVIAHLTLRESIRGKLFLSIAIIALFLTLLASGLGMITIGDQGRVIKDFGLFITSIASVTYAAVAGALLLQKELAKKTIYSILAKPLARWQFILGKFIGMVATGIILSSACSIPVFLLAFFVEGRFDPMVLVGTLYVFLELTIVCAAAIFFSSIVVTPVLTGFLTFAVFVAGRSAQYFLYFVDLGAAKGFAAYLFKGMYWGLPNLAQLNVANSVTFGADLPPLHLVWSLIYALSYSSLLLLLGCIIFNRRDFN